MTKNRVLILGMMALCLTLVCAFLFTSRAEASPAAPIDLTLTQPDGVTTFTARQWGDEWNNGIETVEGYSILQLEDGWWVYAEVQADGLLGPALVDSAPRRVGIDSPEGLPLNLRSTVVRENPNSLEVMGLETPDLNSPQAPTLTNVKTLLLLAKFTDTTELYSAASFQSLMFSTTSSSVRKYYREISFNNMDIVPAQETCGTTDDGATDWTLLAYNHPNTGSSTNFSNQQIVRDVLIANDGCINFAPFDTNTNGYIDSSELQIIVVVAGYEASYDASTPSIWAHAWSLNGVGAPTLDGKIIGNSSHGGYAQFGEKHGGHQATIGVMAHEFGHSIDWPDLYDTDLSSNGVGKWSIMGYGSWNNTVGGYSGDSPAHADAWLKWYQGWITPTVVSGAQYDVSIAQAETNTAAYLLRPNPNGVDWRFYSHSGTGEFFLVENRQKAGYDAGLPGCGLLIWHIDESVTYTNSANANENHALVWLEQADGLNELAGTSDYGDAGDPWPGSGFVTPKHYDFNSGTTPNSNLYSGSASSVSVHIDSTACADTMQADLTYSAGSPPGAFGKSTPANTAMGQSTSLALTWGTSSTATLYEYCIDNYQNSDCGTSWVGVGTNTTSPTLSLDTGTTYEWQVRSTNASALYTYADSNAWWTFTTAGTLGDAYEPDNDFGTAKPIVSGVTQDHSIIPTGDWDHVTFTLGVESGITLGTDGPVGYDTYLYLYNGSFTQIDSDDDGGTGMYSLITITCGVDALPAGTYYVMVHEYSDSNEISSYQLAFNATPCTTTGDSYEPDDVYTQASTIVSGVPQDHTIDPLNDMDWAKFILTETSSVTIETTGDVGGDTYLYLVESDGNTIIAYDDDKNFPTDNYSLIDIPCDSTGPDTLTAGTYYIVVEDYYDDPDTNAYQLAFTASACSTGGDIYEDDDVYTDASTIVSGVPQDHSIVPVGDQDWVTFTLAVESGVTLETSGVSGDTYITLYDSSGTNALDSDNDGGVDAFSLLTYTCDVDALPPDTYYLKVEEYSGSGEISAYQLAFDATPCSTTGSDSYEPDNTYGTASTIVSGTPQDHTIYPVGDQDWVNFTLAAESGITLETSGVSGDNTYLILYESDGTTILEEDDDDGAGMYSLIDRVCGVDALPTGTYYASMNDLGNNNEISAYQLSYTATPCSTEEFVYLPFIMKPYPPPEAFGKASPTNGATGQSTSLTLDWADSNGTTFYEYCYDTSTSGVCAGNWTSTGSTSQAGPISFTGGMSYRWQVRANGPGGTTYADGGTLWNFSIYTAWTTIMTENFEGSFPAGWAVKDYNSSNYGGYYPAKRDCRPYNSSYSGWLVGGGTNGSTTPCGSHYPDHADAWMIYGPFSTVGATAAQIGFEHWIYTEWTTDYLCVAASSNGINFYGDCYSGDHESWTRQVTSLSNLLGHNFIGLPKVWIAFVFTSNASTNFTEGAFVDDILLQKCLASSCVSSSPPYSPDKTPMDALELFLNPFVEKSVHHVIMTLP